MKVILVRAVSALVLAAAAPGFFVACGDAGGATPTPAAIGNDAEMSPETGEADARPNPTEGGTPAKPDAALLVDAAKPEGGAVCHALPATAPVVTRVGDTPLPAALGGAVVPGVYHLTREAYVGAASSNGLYRLTLRFSATDLEITESNVAATAHKRTTSTLTTSGTTMTWVDACVPSGKPKDVTTFGYTATADRVTLTLPSEGLSINLDRVP